MFHAKPMLRFRTYLPGHFLLRQYQKHEDLPFTPRAPCGQLTWQCYVLNQLIEIMDFLRAGAHPTDVRMTTRFKPDDLTEGLTGAIHETGHALYEQGRNLELDGLPINEVMRYLHSALTLLLGSSS